MEGVLLKYVNVEKYVKILNDMHSGVCGGHFMAKTTDHKMTRARFWWPTLFKDSHELVKKCDAFQRFRVK